MRGKETRRGDWEWRSVEGGREDTMLRERAARHAVKYGFIPGRYISRRIYRVSAEEVCAVVEEVSAADRAPRAERCLRSLAHR